MLFDKDKIPFRYIIDLKEDTPVKFIYEISCFMQNENKGEFTRTDAALVSSTNKLNFYLTHLCENGFLEKKGTSYRIIKYPWGSD